MSLLDQITTRTANLYSLPEVALGASVVTTLPSGSLEDGAIIGDYGSGTSHVTVTGTGSTWTIGSDLVVGDNTSGVLTIGGMEISGVDVLHLADDGHPRAGLVVRHVADEAVIRSHPAWQRLELACRAASSPARRPNTAQSVTPRPAR